MKEYSEQLMSIAKELAYLSDEYGREENGDDYCFEQYLYDMIDDTQSSFSVATGATKIVIILDDESDYILKTPIFGEVHYPEIEDEEGNLETDYDSPEFSSWQGAEYSDNGDNYCETELYLYEKAVAAGLADLFTSLKPLLNKDNRTVYVSERCSRCDLYNEDTPSSNSLTFVTEKRSKKNVPWGYLSVRATAKFIDDYGVETTEKLLAFIEEYHISDLHNDNIMINNRTGKIVISDYAGFNC